MPWTPWTGPIFTGGVVWEDLPDESTPLDAANLNTEENAEASYAAQVGQSVFSQITGQLPDPATIEVTGHKDQANGYPGLGADRRLAASELPTAVVTGVSVGGVAQTPRSTIDFKTGVSATDDPANNRIRIAVVDEAFLMARDAGAGAGGDDTTTVQAALNALPARSRVVFEAQKTFNLKNLVIPETRNLKIQIAGVVQAIAGGDADYLIASANYVNNVDSASQPYVDVEVTGKLDGAGLVDKALVMFNWRSAVTGYGEITGAAEGVSVPATTRNGTARNTANTQVEFGVGGSGARKLTVHDCTRRAVNVAFAGATDGFLTRLLPINSRIGNVLIAGGGGWLIEGIHAYNFGVNQPNATTTATATTASGSNVLTAVSADLSAFVGHAINGAGITAGTTIIGVNLDGANTVRLSANATASASGVTVTAGGSDQFGNGWDLHISSGGTNCRVLGNVMESAPALQIRGIGTNNGIPVHDNAFSGSPSAVGGHRVVLQGGNGAAASSEGNTYIGGGQLQANGPGSGTRPFVVHSQGDTFFLPQPFPSPGAGGPALVIATNVHIQDFGTPGVPLDKHISGPQPMTTTSATGVGYRTAAPSSASERWEVGDRVFNSAPSVGNPKSWVCTVAGTPGTWVSEGNL